MKEEQPKKKGNGCLPAIGAIIGLSVLLAVFNGDDKGETGKQSAATVSTVLAEKSPIDKKIHDLIAAGLAKQSFILEANNISHATRTRFDTYIFAPEATSNDLLLATAAGVAMQMQRDNKVQYSSVVVFSDQERTTPYLSVEFAPDRKGNMGEIDSGSRFKVMWLNKLAE